MNSVNDGLHRTTSCGGVVLGVSRPSAEILHSFTVDCFGITLVAEIIAGPMILPLDLVCNVRADRKWASNTRRLGVTGSLRNKPKDYRQ